jgi:ketosteroid isomerase-like protein
MSSHRDVVDRYFEGFRRSDHAQVLSCLTDDVVWDLPGYKHLEGKAQFDTEIENERFTGSPTLTVERLVEDGDTVVALGLGAGTLADGNLFEFAFCTVLTFRSELIRRVESFVAPLTSPDA